MLCFVKGHGKAGGALSWLSSLVYPSFRPLLSHCLPHTLHDLVMLFICCLNTWSTHIIMYASVKVNINTLILKPLWHEFYLVSDDLPPSVTMYLYTHISMLVMNDILQKVFISMQAIKWPLTYCNTVLFVYLSTHLGQILWKHVETVIQQDLFIIRTYSFKNMQLIDSFLQITVCTEEFFTVIVVYWRRRLSRFELLILCTPQKSSHQPHCQPVQHLTSFYKASPYLELNFSKTYFQNPYILMLQRIGPYAPLRGICAPVSESVLQWVGHYASVSSRTLCSSDGYLRICSCRPLNLVYMEQVERQSKCGNCLLNFLKGK